MRTALTQDLFTRISQWCYELGRLRIETPVRIRMHPTTWAALCRDEPPLFYAHRTLHDETPFGGALLGWKLWQDSSCPRRVGGREPTGCYEEDLRELALEALAQQPYYAQLVIDI